MKTLRRIRLYWQLLRRGMVVINELQAKVNYLKSVNQDLRDENHGLKILVNARFNERKRNHEPVH